MIASKRILSTGLVAAAFLVTGTMMAQTKMKTVELEGVSATILVPSDAERDSKSKAYSHIFENDNFLIFIDDYSDSTFDSSVKERMEDDKVSASTKVQNFSNGNLKATYATAVVEEDGEEVLKMFVNAQSINDPKNKIELDIIAYEIDKEVSDTATKILNSITFLNKAEYKSFASLPTMGKVTQLTETAVEASKSTKSSFGSSILSSALDMAVDIIPGGKTAKKIFDGLKSIFGK